jgi:hypothetical protein
MNGTKMQKPHTEDELLQLNLELKNLKKEGTYAKFHGDDLIGVSLIRMGREYLLITPLGQMCPERFCCELQEWGR